MEGPEAGEEGSLQWGSISVSASCARRCDCPVQEEQTPSPPKPTACAHPASVVCCHAAIGPPLCILLPKASGQRAQLCTWQAKDLRFLNGAENAWLKGENNIATIYFPKLKMNAALCGIQFSGGNLMGLFMRWSKRTVSIAKERTDSAKDK